MNEIVERVALALHRDLANYGAVAKELAILDARKAIAALREPTESMIEEGHIAACRHDYGDVVPSGEIGRAAWQAMIDEALK